MPIVAGYQQLSEVEDFAVLVTHDSALRCATWMPRWPLMP